jgi:peptidyl-prolyl cis-trans isomerase D
MLQSIRDKTHGWIAGIIISLLILSFALWGIHSYLVGGSVGDVVATVNGVEIKQSELSTAIERLRRQNNVLSISPALLKNQALQSIINLQVLKQASLKQDYRISQIQVEEYLENIPDFKVNEQFSMARFQQMLNAALYTTNDFLELIRSTLLIDQPRLGIIFSSFSLPNEVNHSIELINQERDVEYITLPFSSFLKQPIEMSQAKIQAYYNQHMKDFQKPEKVSIEYISLSAKNLMDNIHPSDAEILKYYTDYKSSNTQPFEKIKDQMKSALIHQQAEEQFANLKEKLANLTYEHPSSLKPAADALGLTIQTTSDFSKEKGVDELSNQSKVREIAFSPDVLNASNNSDVIAVNNNSAVVLRIKSHSPATASPLNEVKDQITEKLKTVEIENKASQLAKQIMAELKSGQTPEAIANKYKLAWINAGLVTRHSTKVDSAILDIAFDLSAAANSYDIAKLEKGYAVVGIKSIKNGALSRPEDYDAFAEQIQNTQGLLEYQLYKQNLIKKAKIVIES